ncbi:trace amine-associated receptor 13c-like [Xenentodon cancila]
MEIQDGDDLCFPQLFNNSCRKPMLHWTEAAILKILLSFISLITVALNLLVIISVSHFRQLHTPTNILLLSLGVSDFLVGLLLMPGEILRNTSCWFFGDNMCVLYCYLVCHIVCASIQNIVLISVDRYVAICHPLHYSTRITFARVKCCALSCWFGTALYSIIYVKDELVQPGRTSSCAGECTFIIDNIAGTSDFVLNFIYPISVIVLLYLRVFVVAVSQARAMRSHITAVPQRYSKKSEMKAARTLGLLVIVYLLCFCPYYGYSFVEINILQPGSCEANML